MYTASQISDGIATNGTLTSGSAGVQDGVTGTSGQAGLPYVPLPTVGANFTLPFWNLPEAASDALVDGPKWGSPYFNAPLLPAYANAAGGISAAPAAAVSAAPAGAATIPSAAARAFDLTSGGGCGAIDYAAEKQSLYNAQRLFGNIRLAQGKGDVGEVLMNGSATIANPSLIQSVVQGSAPGTGHDAYRDDTGKLTPFASIGGSAGGIVPQLYVGTISEGLTIPPKTETQTLRSFIANDVPSTFNIFPESEADAMRKENACRLNRIQQNYIKSRLQAASNMQW